MKTITSFLAGSALAVLLVVPAISLAEEVTPVVPQGNGSPELVVNGYGVKNSDVAHVVPGTVAYDAAGIALPCPASFAFGPNMYCLDISGTETYKAGARQAAKQMQALGFSLGLYAYWLTH